MVWDNFVSKVRKYHYIKKSDKNFPWSKILESWFEKFINTPLPRAIWQWEELNELSIQ